MSTIYSRLYDNKVLMSESFVTTAVVLNSLRAFAFNEGYVMGTNKNKLTGGDSDDDGLTIEELIAQMNDDENEDDDNNDDLYEAIAVKKADKDDKYQGAWVMNPNHMTSSGFKVMGNPTMRIHDLMADLDIGSKLIGT